MDIAIVGKLSPNSFEFDWDTLSNDLLRDNGLETAVLISIFTDRRVLPEELPPEETNLRGWWGDCPEVNEIQGDFIGSKLWLLAREKSTPAVLQRAEDYCREALQWLLEDGIVSTIEIEADFTDDRKDTMAIRIEMKRANGQVVNFNFDYVWKAQELKIA